MVTLPFRPDRKLIDVLASSPFTLSAEVIPPRNGTEQIQVLTQIQSLVNAGAEFLSVTKGAGGSLRGGSLPIAQAIKEQYGRPCIAHFTCRDLIPVDVENQLMDHHYFGIRNILALRGDPPDGQPEWKPREGGYHYAHQLITQIRNLNEGRYLSRANGPAVSGPTERTDFCIGAAVYPEYPDPKDRVEFFKIKVEAGAQFGITDMLFDADNYARFLDACGKAGLPRIPILPGTRILKSRAQAIRIATKFKTSVPQHWLDRLPETDGPEGFDRGIELFTEFSGRLKQLGAPGIHLYVIADTKAATHALSLLARRS